MTSTLPGEPILVGRTTELERARTLIGGTLESQGKLLLIMLPGVVGNIFGISNGREVPFRRLIDYYA